MEEGSAAATILCPLPVSRAKHSSRVGHTAGHPEQGHGAPSQAAECQASCRQASGSSTPGAVVQKIGGRGVPAMPVRKRRRV
jgi:hypothetical protein